MELTNDDRAEADRRVRVAQSFTACAYCHAAKGDPCITPRGNVMQTVHYDRDETVSMEETRLRLLGQDGPLTEAETLMAAALQFHRAFRAQDDTDEGIANARAYGEAARVLAKWTENGQVPRLGPTARQRLRESLS